jgi:hypothetical protein
MEVGPIDKMLYKHSWLSTCVSTIRKSSALGWRMTLQHCCLFFSLSHSGRRDRVGCDVLLFPDVLDHLRLQLQTCQVDLVSSKHRIVWLVDQLPSLPEHGMFFQVVCVPAELLLSGPHCLLLQCVHGTGQAFFVVRFSCFDQGQQGADQVVDDGQWRGAS